MEIEIIHDQEGYRFYTVIDGREGVIQYSFEDDSRLVIDVYRTYVPEELRGHRIAEKLVETLLAWAKKEGLHVHPTCSYVVMYFRRHKEHADLLSGNTDPENGGSCRLR